jgi:hypothetical protein
MEHPFLCATHRKRAGAILKSPALHSAGELTRFQATIISFYCGPTPLCIDRGGFHSRYLGLSVTFCGIVEFTRLRPDREER